MNSIQLVGRLVVDPELRFSQSGTPIANFRVAVNRPVKRDATGRTPADFLRVTAFRKTAEIVAQYAHQGDLVSVEGAVRTDQYTDRDGVKRYGWGVIANRVGLLAKKGGNGGGNGAQAPEVAGEGAYDAGSDVAESMAEPEEIPA